MKKILYFMILILVVLSISSCGKKTTKVSIITPSGTPSLALATYLYQADADYEIVNGSDPLVAAFSSCSHDIIIAPVNLGVKMYNANGNYLLFNTFFWGNNYLISKNTLSSINDLNGKEVVIFGQNSTPDMIFQAILKSYTDVNATLTYVADVATANSLVASGKADYAVSAEPALSKVKSSVNLNIIDLQAEWEKITGNSSYPQAGIFVKKDSLSKDYVKNALNDIDTAINQAISHPDKCASSAMEIDSSFKALGKDILMQAIPNCHFMLLNKEDEITAIKYYLNKMIELGFSKQVGGSVPDENFFVR